MKQKPVPENFSGLPVATSGKTFYAIMIAANLPSRAVWFTNTGAKWEWKSERNRYEYRVKVNHAAVEFKDRPVCVPAEENPLTRDSLVRKPVERMKRRGVPLCP